ncbi:hypothetical protein [Microbulbifer sp. JMSA003]|uniref:hypothetical protein n=1 Tax=unclassified Microbulbifer TaxID=2619833 RepID=UPI00403A29A5
MAGSGIPNASAAVVNRRAAGQYQALPTVTTGTFANLMGRARKAVSNMLASMGSSLNPARICYKAPNRADNLENTQPGDPQKVSSNLERNRSSSSNTSLESVLEDDVPKAPSNLERNHSDSNEDASLDCSLRLINRMFLDSVDDAKKESSDIREVCENLEGQQKKLEELKDKYKEHGEYYLLTEMAVETLAKKIDGLKKILEAKKSNSGDL